MSLKKIRVSSDFSDTPGGRFKVDGPYSGEEFREKLLIPALENHSKVIIDFDGGEGYGSSFLEESFGGAVAKKGLPFVQNKLDFISTEDDYLVDEVKKYMDKAHDQSKGTE